MYYLMSDSWYVIKIPDCGLKITLAVKPNWGKWILSQQTTVYYPRKLYTSLITNIRERIHENEIKNPIAMEYVKLCNFVIVLTGVDEGFGDV